MMMMMVPPSPSCSRSREEQMMVEGVHCHTKTSLEGEEQRPSEPRADNAKIESKESRCSLQNLHLQSYLSMDWRRW